MEALASIFGIDVLTYAVMSNYIHLILRNRPDVVAQWSDEEVAIRWLRVFPGKRLEEHLAEPTERSLHTSAFDRIEGEKGTENESAAFDLVAVDNEEAVKILRKTPLSERRSKKRITRPGRKPKRVKRDSWLAPLSLGRKLASDPEVSRSGLRASDKGFLNLAWREYLELLRWTSQQKSTGEVTEVPRQVGRSLSRLGIASSMWRDLVWNFKRYFGRSTCAGLRKRCLLMRPSTPSRGTPAHGKCKPALSEASRLVGLFGSYSQRPV
jgi:hypothetical protein